MKLIIFEPYIFTFYRALIIRKWISVISFLKFYFTGKTDPYVILSLGDQIIRSKKNSQTTVIGPPGEPIWNQVSSIHFLLHQLSCILSGTFGQWDHLTEHIYRTSFSNHVYAFLGRIFICLLQILENRSYTFKWRILLDSQILLLVQER